MKFRLFFYKIATELYKNILQELTNLNNAYFSQVL